MSDEIKTHVISREYEQGFERAGLGKSPTSRQRGRFVWDERQQRLVPIAEYVPPSEARNAPIIADRIHESTVSPIDGSDIGSRRKRREHMRAYGVEDATDISPAYREKQAKQRELEDHRKRRAALDQAARTLYQQGKWR